MTDQRDANMSDGQGGRPDGRVPADRSLDALERLLVYRSLEEAHEDRVVAAEMADAARSADLAAEFDAIQAFDSGLVRQLADVEVPEGLDRRLLAALASSLANAPLDDRPVVGKSRRANRRYVQWLVAACLLVALVVAWWRPWRSPVQPWTPVRLASKSAEWIGELDPQGWRPVRPQDLSKFRMPPALAIRADRIQVDRFDGRRGAVVQGKTARGNGDVFLVIIPLEGTLDLPSSPPPRPLTATSGWMVGVWQSGGFVYVLRMRGSTSDYRRVIGADAPLA